jgi:hypothetical protein
MPSPVDQPNAGVAQVLRNAWAIDTFDTVALTITSCRVLAPSPPTQ